MPSFLRGIGLIALLSCQRPPNWLDEAPLIGMRVKDDAGRILYLKRPPTRVALCTPEAIGLWSKAGLFSYVVAACAGMGEESRLFYLPCMDSLALPDALFRSKAEWIWTSHPSFLQREHPFAHTSYVFSPRSTKDWLTHLGMLGKVYDIPSISLLADSLLHSIELLSVSARKGRRFRVLVLCPADPVAFLTHHHPLASLIDEAGGSIPYTGSLPIQTFPAETLLHSPPDILLVPEGASELLNDLLTQYPDAYTFPAVQYKRIFSIEKWMIEAPFTDPVRGFYTLLQIIHPEIGNSSLSQPARNNVENRTQKNTD
ncbi:MAG: hypothetical protein N2170_09180 [Bacteroidia bacterium]|nr:hypothetical protein [Bacteroidia bacterium]